MLCPLPRVSMSTMALICIPNPTVYMISRPTTSDSAPLRGRPTTLTSPTPAMADTASKGSYPVLTKNATRWTLVRCVPSDANNRVSTRNQTGR